MAEVLEGVRVSAEGDDGAASFQRMIAPVWPDVLRFADRLAPWPESEDVVQDALATAWERRASYNPRRGSVRVWLLMLVADQARRRRRRTDRQRRARPLTNVSPPGEMASDVDLQRALQTLTHRQREAVYLRYFIDLPVAEIATVMHCRVGTVKATLATGRAKLRRSLTMED